MATTLKAHPVKSIISRESDLQIDRVVISPEMASAWLEKNKNNRKVTKGNVNKFARDMRSGAWRLVGDPIRFDTTGRLIDGQHRLMACVKSGVTFETIVIYGLHETDQDLIDSGKSRSISDVFSLRNINYSTRTAATLRALISYRSDNQRIGTMSHTEMTKALEKHPNITKSVTAVTTCKIKATPYPSMAFLHYVATTFLDKEELADSMLETWRTGIPAYTNDPIHTLRERFIRIVEGQSRVRTEVMGFTLFAAWNSYVKKDTAQKFHIRSKPVDIDGLNRDLL